MQTSHRVHYSQTGCKFYLWRLEIFFLINVISKPSSGQKVTWFNANYQKLPHNTLQYSHKKIVSSASSQNLSIFCKFNFMQFDDYRREAANYFRFPFFVGSERVIWVRTSSWYSYSERAGLDLAGAQSNYILTMRLEMAGTAGNTDTTRIALLQLNLIEILEFLLMVIRPDDT